jgi:hypothetical protein
LPFLRERLQQMCTLFLMDLLPCDQAYEKKTTPKWRYDLGRKKNFEQVGTIYWHFLHVLRILIQQIN